MEKLDVEERQKIATIRREKGSQSSGVDWMYKSEKPDSEEYLLGKRIDKHIEGTTEPKDDDANALFGERIKANIAMDMAAKMREDPLFAIRRKEEESRKKLLENPVKMKELQKLIDQQQKEKEKALKKKKKKDKKNKKKKKHKKKDSDEDGKEEEEDSDDGVGDEDNIMKKYLAILTSKNSVSDVKGKKRRKKNEEDDSDSHSQNNSDSEDNRGPVMRRPDFRRKQSSPVLNHRDGDSGSKVHEDRGRNKHNRERDFEQGIRGRDNNRVRARSPHQSPDHDRERGDGKGNRSSIDRSGNNRMGDRGRDRRDAAEFNRNRERMGGNWNRRRDEIRDSRSGSRERIGSSWRGREQMGVNRNTGRMRDNRSRSRERVREAGRKNTEQRHSKGTRDMYISRGGTDVGRDRRVRQDDGFRVNRQSEESRNRDWNRPFDHRYSRDKSFRIQEQGMRDLSRDDNRMAKKVKNRRGSSESDDSEDETVTNTARDGRSRSGERRREYALKRESDKVMNETRKHIENMELRRGRDMGIRRDSHGENTRERKRNDSRNSHSDTDEVEKKNRKGKEFNVKRNAKKERARSRSSSSSSSTSSSALSHSSIERKKTEAASIFQGKAYGLIRPEGGSGNKRKRSSSASSSSSSSSDQKQSSLSYPRKQKPLRQATPPRHKLTDEEKKRRLEEMMDNAKWRDEQRAGNVKRYKEEEERERDDKEKSKGKGFLSSMMVDHASTSSVEDRLKRNRYNIQRTKAALSKNFTQK